MVSKSLLGLLLLAAIAGCDSYTCSCPSDGCDFTCSSGEAVIPLPSDGKIVASVTADNGCSASLELASDRIVVKRSGAGSCTLHVVFSDGATDVAGVRFKKVSYPCDCILAGDVSPLEPANAGAP